MKYIKSFNEITRRELELVGGKGLSLGAMTTAALPVPPGYVLTTDAWKDFHNTGIPPETKAAILAAFIKLGVERVAVRSSARGEDSAEASWAGQFETYLNVQRSGLIEAIEKCWRSALSESALSYARSGGLMAHQLAVAVIVQKMVSSEVSGVAFSTNPVTKNTGEIMIEAIYGLGELLVQGQITPDNYLLDKTSGELISQNIAGKEIQLVFHSGQNREQSVPADKVNKACLNAEQIGELSALVRKIEAYYGSPQDIEWAYADSQFYILQSRPITTL